jgi:hypothetical protein
MATTMFFPGIVAVEPLSRGSNTAPEQNQSRRIAHVGPWSRTLYDDSRECGWLGAASPRAPCIDVPDKVRRQALRLAGI